MDKKKKQLPSCSSPMKLDHLFGPKDSTSAAVFSSIFPPSSAVGGRDSRMQDAACKNNGTQGNQSRGGESNRSTSNKNTGGNYQNETVEPSYYSSSIYYGGQENYCQRARTTDSHPVFKKDRDDDDPDGNSPPSASRGNWWQGSLYY
ncbi:uncharacterized protein LOC114748491 isoform X2 [Neltuma alba]|uniref:uncharacterized protein LOC114748491 isoform X2 n=1 Tax=Neltuma alba TaxID=207710 RepID=UPI0010A4A5A9|nr:uncharacterized protein LOC114748491 isoform X2 [Prosopis alba]